MTTFTTTITAMYTVQQPDPNYVVNTIWKVTGVDGSYTAHSGGNTTFSSTQSSIFIPYDQLTEAIVISWISEEEITSAQSAVQGQLDSMINPPVSPQNTPLPWSA